MTNSFELVVRNGTIVAHDRIFQADIGVSDGIVTAVGDRLGSGDEDWNAAGLHILPGLIDSHVHFREPGMTWKGGFGDGTRAAAAGGVTTVLDMPNTVPPVTTAERFGEKLELVLPKAHVDFGLYGLFAGDNAHEFPALAEAGSVGLKLYLGKSVGGNLPPGDGAVYEGLLAARDAGLVVGVHAENDEIVDHFTAILREKGRSDAASHSEARPEIAEVEAVTRIITLASSAGAAIHIHHLSTAAALDTVAVLRAAGRLVTVEAVVAHLLLDQSAYARYGNLVKLNPPMRTSGDATRLWQGITDKEIDTIATDHAPHTREEQAESDVWKAHGGFIGVETMLPLLLTRVAAGILSLSDVVRLCSYNPALRWSLKSKGRVQVGADADFAIVDVDAVGRIDSHKLNSLSTSTPFDGWPTVGSVRRVYLRGNLVAEEGVPVGSPSGRLVRPSRENNTVAFAQGLPL